MNKDVADENIMPQLLEYWGLMSAGPNSVDIKNRNSANVGFNVDEDNKTNRQFKFHLKCENFDKILIDDYDAEVSPDKLLMLYNRNKFLKYWIALEPSSEFDSNENEVKNNA